MPDRLVVDDAYLTASNGELKRTNLEILGARNGQNPSGKGTNKAPAQSFDAMRLIVGAPSYASGANLAARIEHQSRTFSEQLTARGTYLAKFIANVEIFLRDADEAEDLSDMQAAEVAHLFPA